MTPDVDEVAKECSRCRSLSALNRDIATRGLKTDKRMNRIGFNCIGSDSSDSIQSVEENQARPLEFVRNRLIFYDGYAVQWPEARHVGKRTRIAIST
jgi:hypothetical protein